MDKNKNYSPQLQESESSAMGHNSQKLSKILPPPRATSLPICEMATSS